MEFKNKNVNIDGRLTIPVEIRQALNIDLNTPLTVKLTEDRKILIEVETTVCQFCGEPHQLHTIDNITICDSCIKKINKSLPKKGK